MMIPTIFSPCAMAAFNRCSAASGRKPPVTYGGVERFGAAVPVVVITAKDLTQKDRDRLNGGVERIIQKSDRDEMLRQLSREITRCVKQQTRERVNEDFVRRGQRR
jgi:hypothetical protein